MFNASKMYCKLHDVVDGQGWSSEDLYTSKQLLAEFFATFPEQTAFDRKTDAVVVYYRLEPADQFKHMDILIMDDLCEFVVYDTNKRIARQVHHQTMGRLVRQVISKVLDYLAPFFLEEQEAKKGVESKTLVEDALSEPVWSPRECWNGLRFMEEYLDKVNIPHLVKYETSTMDGRAMCIDFVKYELTYCRFSDDTYCFRLKGEVLYLEPEYYKVGQLCEIIRQATKEVYDMSLTIRDEPIDSFLPRIRRFLNAQHSIDVGLVNDMAMILVEYHRDSSRPQFVEPDGKYGFNFIRATREGRSVYEVYKDLDDNDFQFRKDGARIFSLVDKVKILMTPICALEEYLSNPTPDKGAPVGSIPEHCCSVEGDVRVTHTRRKTDNESAECRLATYAEEMLKIRNMLYPNSEQVCKSICMQIETVIGLMIDLAPTGELVGRGARYNYYRTDPGYIVFSAMLDNQFVSVTLDEKHNRIQSNVFYNGSVPTQGELMHVFQIITNIYKRFC